MGFERLVRKMDEIANEIDEEVVIQIGSTNYVPKNAKYFHFLVPEDMNQKYEESTLIIAHGGAGTILDAMAYNKPLIIIPRLKKFYEAIDDSQLELAESLGNSNMASFVIDIDELPGAIKNRQSSSYSGYTRSASLINYIKKKLNEGPV